MTIRLDALLLPSDAPPRHSNIKRNVLFFDSVSLIDPSDKSLINGRKITEQFNQFHIWEADRATFPRTENYEDGYREIIAHTRQLQTRGIVRILNSRQSPNVDLGINWTLYNSAISNDELVRAAVPDIGNDKPSISIPSCVLSGREIHGGNQRSKYALDCNSPFQIPHFDEAWSDLAHLRIGRAIKFLRLAYGKNISPLASDHINHHIVTALTQHSIPCATPSQSDESLANLSISLDVMDPQSLENVLNDMSWDEVIRLRREILPRISNLRIFLMNRVNAIYQGKRDLEIYRQEMLKTRLEFESMKESLAEEWGKLRIGATFKFGGISGASATGLTLLPSFNTWQEVTTLIVSSGLIAASSLTDEIKSLIPAHRKVRTHPLYFLDSICLHA
ncbi:MAG: hypothetical protein WC208_02185 [Gallionella sp.]|jgi:hypothetical protein